MSTEIVQWAVVKNNHVDYLYATEERAKKQVEFSGGTVVKLTGTMPRELRKVSTEVWIRPCKTDSNHDFLGSRLGYEALSSWRFDNSIKARITLEELEVPEQ